MATVASIESATMTLAWSTGEAWEESESEEEEGEGGRSIEGTALEDEAEDVEGAMPPALGVFNCKSGDMSPMMRTLY